MKKLDLRQYKTAVGRITPRENFADSIILRLREPQKRRHSGRIIAIAAVMVMLAAGSVIGAAALEAKEYRDAVTFFDAYALPTAELTRSEIKAVYRDITTGSFSLDKTGEIILREVEGTIEGQAITPSAVEAAWNIRNSTGGMTEIFAPQMGEYRFEVVEYMDEERGFLMEDYTLVRRCGSGEQVLWEIELDNFFVDGYIPVKGGILVWGHTFTWSSTQSRVARVALISDDGKLVWEKYHQRYKNDMPAAAVADGERLVVFGRGNFVDLTVTVYDYAGNELLYRAHEIGNTGIRQAVKLGDGYLVRLSHYQTGDKLIKLDRDGALLDTLTYTADDVCYVMTDMLELGGQLYLSAYAFPTPASGDVQGRNELAPVFAYIFDDGSEGSGHWNITSAELVPLLREQYTAVLFVCDPASGEPKQFYAVDGALGGELGMDTASQLCWDTQHFTDAYFSPATSAFSIAASCKILRYTFAQDGTLLGETDTGEICGYMR
ncbi:MAG: hypothetical protein IKD37_03870 [Clostridia bacterium]|nr:hypothetical protein [Clostridia bacterium]